MLSAQARRAFTVVLAGARNPSNIGAAARAMQDFGFSDLRVVNDYASPYEAAQLEDLQAAPPRSAVGAASVMQRARRFDTIAEAIADCTLVVGTTAIGGRELEREILTLQQAAPRMTAALQASAGGDAAQRVALVFGSEKTGLTNDQLSYCSLLLTIPLFAPSTGEDGKPARHLSMNLGQSVAVCLYELTREGFEDSREIPVLHQTPATGEDRERLTQMLLEVMHTTGYARRFPANSREAVVRRLVEKLGASRDEASTWMGLLRHILRRSGIATEKVDA